MIYDRYRHRASVPPMEVPPVTLPGGLMVGTIAQRIEQRNLEAAKRRSRPPHELSWSEQQEERASAGVVEKTDREALAERIHARERRQQLPQVEEVPPPGPALAAAIVRAGAKARGEAT